MSSLRKLQWSRRYVISAPARYSRSMLPRILGWSWHRQQAIRTAKRHAETRAGVVVKLRGEQVWPDA